MARKKATKSDIYYIENHQGQSAEELGAEIGLDPKEVSKYIVKLKPAKKKGSSEPKLGRSKITLKTGGVVYQMTEDIDSKAGPKPKNTPKQDEAMGIYRRK